MAVVVSLVQGQPVEGLAKLFEATGFWEHWVQNPGSREEWLAALSFRINHCVNVKTYKSTVFYFAVFHRSFQIESKLC